MYELILIYMNDGSKEIRENFAKIGEAERQ